MSCWHLFKSILWVNLADVVISFLNLLKVGKRKQSHFYKSVYFLQPTIRNNKFLFFSSATFTFLLSSLLLPFLLPFGYFASFKNLIGGLHLRFALFQLHFFVVFSPVRKPSFHTWNSIVKNQQNSVWEQFYQDCYYRYPLHPVDSPYFGPLWFYPATEHIDRFYKWLESTPHFPF